MAKKPAESESESGAESESGTASESGAASESGSASEAPAESDDDTEAAEPKKSAAASGKGKKTSGRAPSQKAAPKTSARAAPPRPRGSGHELVPVICSECYEELVFDSGVSSDVLTCPVCEHQAARPDDAQLAIIASHRSSEKTNFMISLILCLVSLGAFFFWINALRNPHTNANENNALFYGPSVIAGLCYLGCLIFTLAKYEGNRHEVYF
jgi:hypothetical protein